MKKVIQFILPLAMLLIIAPPILTGCPTGTYSFGKWCEACPSGCIACTGMHYCSSCKSGYKMKDDFSDWKKCESDSPIPGIPMRPVELVITIIFFLIFKSTIICGIIYAYRNPEPDHGAYTSTKTEPSTSFSDPAPNPDNTDTPSFPGPPS